MSLENTKSFYQRISTDENFSAKFQGLENQEEFYYAAKTAGYEFTEQEFEDYTCKLLCKGDDLNDEIQDLSEEELASVLGGFIRHFPPLHPMYGIVRPIFSHL